MNPEIMPDMQAFIRQRWPDLTIGEKIGFLAWRAVNFRKKPREYSGKKNKP